MGVFAVSRALLLILLGYCGFFAGTAEAQMVVNGSLADWEEIPALPTAPRDVGHDSAYGAVREMRAAADAFNLYILIEFQMPRPFANPQVPVQLARGYFD